MESIIDLGSGWGMNIFSNTDSTIENTTTISTNNTTITINSNNNNNYNKGSVSSAVISSSTSARCGASSGCDGDGVQVRTVAVNILNKHWRTSDKGCPPVWWLRELLTTQHRNSLLRFGTFHRASDWDWSFGTELDMRFGKWMVWSAYGYGTWKISNGYTRNRKAKPRTGSGEEIWRFI